MQGFGHVTSNGALDVVRLCFCAYVKEEGNWVRLTDPVVSRVIKDSHVFNDLKIVDYSDDWAAVDTQKKILILCEKLGKNDVEVHFAQQGRDGGRILEKVKIADTDIHHQYGISLKTPRITGNIQEPAMCSMKLHSPKTREDSNSVNFTFFPSGQMPSAHVDEVHNVVRTNSKRSRQPNNSDVDCPAETSLGQVYVPPKRQGPDLDFVGEGPSDNGVVLRGPMVRPALCDQQPRLQNQEVSNCFDDANDNAREVELIDIIRSALTVSTPPPPEDILNLAVASNGLATIDVSDIANPSNLNRM